MEMQNNRFDIGNQSSQNILDMACKISCKPTAGDVILLKGPIGSGKTLFARNFILESLKACQLWDEVPSPSFSLIQVYDMIIPRICHVDLYRLSLRSEVLELGLDELYGDSITLIEWPDRLENRLPERYVQIEFSLDDHDENLRNLSILFVGPNWNHLSSLFGEIF